MAPRVASLCWKTRNVDYEQAKTLSTDPDARKRRKVAQQPDVRPEILFYLADDADAVVPCGHRDVVGPLAHRARVDACRRSHHDGDFHLGLARRLEHLHDRVWRGRDDRKIDRRTDRRQ